MGKSKRKRRWHQHVSKKAVPFKRNTFGKGSKIARRKGRPHHAAVGLKVETDAIDSGGGKRLKVEKTGKDPLSVGNLYSGIHGMNVNASTHNYQTYNNCNISEPPAEHSKSRQDGAYARGSMETRKRISRSSTDFIEEPKKRVFHLPEDPPKDLIEELRKRINNQYRRKDTIPVTSCHNDLVEPSFEHDVRMFWVTRFYRGSLMSLYQNDECGGTAAGEEIDYRTLVQCIAKYDGIRIAVAGPSASGKTIVKERLSRDLAKREENFLIFNWSFTDVADDSEIISPCDLLLKGLLPPDCEISDYYEQILEEQSRIIFLLDDLEKVDWQINDKSNLIRSNGRGKRSEIYSSIMRKELLPESKVVLFSRPQTLSSLVDKVRPKIVVALNGLCPAHSELLFKSFMGERGMVLWKKLQMQCPSLIPLLSMPGVLLSFSTHMYDEKHDYRPIFLTDAVCNLLEIFKQSSSITERNELPTIMTGLEKLAHSGMVKGKTSFHINDLKEVFLEETDKDKRGMYIKWTRDFIITIPKLNTCNAFLNEDKFAFFFHHPIIQQFLTAQYIIKKDYEVFKRDINQYLVNTSDITTFASGFLLFASGLLFNNGDDADQDKVPVDVALKRKAFGSMLSEKYSGSHLTSIELLAVISESNYAPLIQRIVRNLRIEKVVLDNNDIYTIASVMRHLIHLNELVLRSCNLTSENLRALWENSSLQISKLDVSGNHLDEDAISILSDIAKRCSVEELIVRNCGLNDGSLATLRASAARVTST